MLYEEYGTDHIRVNFITADLNKKVEDADLDYPQQPCSQRWIVDYPLLAYKTYSPMNKEIAIIHMAINMP